MVFNVTFSNIAAIYTVVVSFIGDFSWLQG